MGRSAVVRRSLSRPTQVRRTAWRIPADRALRDGQELMEATTLNQRTEDATSSSAFDAARTV